MQENEEVKGNVDLHGNYRLQAKDYTVTDANKKYQENGTMTVTGKGNFEGAIQIPVIVSGKKSDLQTINVVADAKTAIYFDPARTYAEAKAELSGLIRVYSSTDKKKEQALFEGRDYFITYPSNLLDAGSKSLTIIGLGDYSGSVSKKFTVKPLSVKSADSGTIITNAANVAEKEYFFSQAGVTIGSDLKVTYISPAGKAIDLVEGRDYKLTYSNNKKASTEYTSQLPS